MTSLIGRFADNPEMIPIALLVLIGAIAFPIAVINLCRELWLMWRERGES